MSSRGGGMMPMVRMPSVRLSENRDATPVLEVKVPLAQAALCALSATLSLLLFYLTVNALGQGAWVMTCSVFGIAAVVWVHVAGKMRPSVEVEVDGWPLTHALGAFLLVALVGAVGWCTATAAAMYFPLMSDAAPWLRVTTFAGFVFFGLLTVLLSSAFVQELLLRSPFVERAIGEALSFYLKQKATLDAQEQRYIMVHSGGKPAEPTPGEALAPSQPSSREEPAEPSTDIDPGRQEWDDFLEFITLAYQHPKERGFQRSNWKNVALRSGRAVGTRQAREWINLLAGTGLLVKRKGRWEPAYTLEECLRAVTYPQGVPGPSVEYPAPNQEYWDKLGYTWENDDD